MADAHLRTFFMRYVAALNTHEFQKLAELMRDDLIVNGQPMTRDEVIAGLEGHIDAVPDLVWRVTDIAIEGERVAARFFNRGTPGKDWLGAKPTGATVEFAEHVFHKVRDGRFYELNFLLDVVSVRNQLAP
jgi:predicted ester cyclase